MSPQEVKSCDRCPSFLTPQQARDTFGRPTGAPMCAQHGYILGVSGQSPKDAAETRRAFASDCAEYGEPAPSVPVSLRPRVSSISEDVINEGPTGTTVSTCSACRNCVKHTAVMEQWGWPLPLCKAKGTLIFDQVKEAIGDPSRSIDPCPWANPGMPSDVIVGVELRKEFRPDFVQNPVNTLKLLVDNGRLTVYPEDYETDGPVSPADEAQGIRAWRRLDCPFGTGNQAWLPIFRRDYFDPDWESRIPRTGDSHNPELYVDYSNLLWRFAVTTVQREKTLLVQSQPGLGKTEFTYWLAWLMQVPWTRIFFTDSIEWDDIFGTLLFQDGETKWTDGDFTEAFQIPGIECVDEPNLARSEIISTLRTTTERVPMLYLNTSAKGVQHNVTRQGHPYNWRVWCANPAWDPRNIGTKELASADISRLAPAVLEYPPPEIERHIIRNTTKKLEGFDIPDNLLTDLLKVSADLRELSENQDYPGTWGIRENLDVAGNLAWYPFEESFRMAALNYFAPDVAKNIIETSINLIRE